VHGLEDLHFRNHSLCMVLVLVQILNDAYDDIEPYFAFAGMRFGVKARNRRLPSGKRFKYYL
jgi:hypothetical protein